MVNSRDAESSEELHASAVGHHRCDPQSGPKLPGPISELLMPRTHVLVHVTKESMGTTRVFV